MPLIGGGLAMSVIEGQHMVWIDGYQGSGKSSLAVRIAHDLLRRGYVKYCISNIPIVFADELEDVIPTGEGSQIRLNCVVILDELGKFLKTGRDVGQFSNFLRKLNVILLGPSVEEPATAFRKLRIERTFDFTNLGIPAWSYMYEIRRGGDRKCDKFIWTNPQEVYGLYDSDAKPIDDAYISEFLNYWVDIAVEAYKEERPEWKRRAEIWSDRKGIGTRNSLPAMESSGGNADLVLEAAQIIEEAASTMAMAGEKGRKRSKRR